LLASHPNITGRRKTSIGRISGTRICAKMTVNQVPVTPGDGGTTPDAAFEGASRFGEAADPIHLVGQDGKSCANIPINYSRCSDACPPDPHPVTKGVVTGEVGPLGLHVKEAIATVDQLEGLGLQRMKIPLPKCIVLGMYRSSETRLFAVLITE